MCEGGDRGELIPIPGYRIWTINAVLYVLPTAVFFKTSYFRNIIRILQVISIRPLLKFSSNLHFMESFDDKLETIRFFVPKYLSVYFKDLVPFHPVSL